MMRFSCRSTGISLALSITLTSAAAAASMDIQLLPEITKFRRSNLPGYGIALQKCTICHSTDYIAYQPPGMSQTQWTAEMAKMQSTYGAPIDGAEIKSLGVYLAVMYGDAKSVSGADLASETASVPAASKGTTRGANALVVAPADAIDPQVLLGKSGCLSCHSLNKKVVGPAYRDVAARYKGNAQAASGIESSIRKGSVGKWGSAPMPPFAGLTAAEIKVLVDFILRQ